MSAYKKNSVFLNNLTRALGDFLILVMVAVAAALGLAGIIFLLEAGWGLYQATAVGGYYFSTRGAPDFIHFLQSLNTLVFATQTTSISLVISVLAAFLSHSLGMLSHLYIGKGLMFRILLWGFPVAWLTALYVQTRLSRRSLDPFYCGTHPHPDHVFTYIFPAQNIVPA